MTYAILFAGSGYGIYIPQHFAEAYNAEQWRYIDAADIEELLKGPDAEFYWEAWESVLDSAETVDGAVLHQDGDLWVIHAQKAIDAINEHCEVVREYEETHKDAGDNYAHMPAESWTSDDTAELMRKLAARGVDTNGVDPDHVADMALDLFQMEPHHIYSKPEGICIAAFPVSEIEIDISELGIEGIALDYVSDACEPHINGTLAYLTSDCVWCAVVDPEAMKEAIADYKEER